MNIKQIIKDSLITVSIKPDEGADERLIHRNRSRNFVEELAKTLRDCYKDVEGFRVFSKHYEDHRLEFGLNELLYDILVCKTAVGEKDLRYVTKAIWQIESEFAPNSREAMYDFNKLVLGFSENKLFIGPQVSDEKDFLKPLIEPARHCLSNTFVALVPHPSDWKSRTRDLDVHCWKFDNGWQPV